MIQVTLIRIEGYGPWTLTLGSDREHALQMLQAKLYSDIQMQFSKSNGLAFFNRFDEIFAITNGISIEQHREILDTIRSSYDELDITMAIGRGKTPYQAHLDAYNARNNSNGKVIESSSKFEDGYVQIMHVDVDHFTSKISSRLSPYEISALIFDLYAKLAYAFMDHQALTFFLGGDNFMIPSNGISKDEALMIIDKVSKELNIELKCGIGKAKTAREAASMATNALDTIRDMRDEGRIEKVYELSCL
ncbi:MAG: GTP cyclohydrolase IIa [Candidatus Nitrosothermus koennekii]|nr:MAG: GTP cyclohydrolase IIa [Candidatus Nitrosothermus koennekii]